MGTNRLTATVVGLSQIAQAARPSIVVRNGKASFGFWWADVEQGTTTTEPCNVAFIDKTTIGRRFQNSGSCASFGKLHQYICRTRGAAFSVGATLGGNSSSSAIDAYTHHPKQSSKNLRVAGWQSRLNADLRRARRLGKVS